MNDRYTLPARRPSRKSSPRWRMRPVAVALACMGAAPAFAQLPTWNNFQVRGGVVTVGTPTAGGTQLGITQATQRAIVDWQGFSIGPGNAVNISQPGATSVLLNRVTGNELSTIAGSMTANGRVFLVNPNGVLFTGTSAINVGGLVASTLAMATSDDAFMGGTERFEFRQVDGSVGDVINNGAISTRGMGGTVGLIGATVSNNGSVVAQGGTAGLVSADAVTVDFAGDGLTTFKVSPGLYSSVSNGGLVQADGGRVLLMATAGGEIAQGVVNTRGVLRADSLASRNGEIILDSGSSNAGVTITGGTLSAVGNGAGLSGGKIEVTGRSILVEPFQSFVALPPINEPSRFDAGGSAGGGSILLHAVAVGDLPQTGAIAIASGSTLRADATGAGNGGDLRVMAERTLRAYGALSARGGPGGGNGGFIETSGGYAVPAGDNNGGIELTGLRADASAPAGVAGRWLIDPYDVTIVNGTAAGTLTGNPFDPIANSTLQDGDINAALNAGTSVRITTGNAAAGLPTAGDIVMDDVLIDYNTAMGPLTFQLDAHRSVRGNGASVISSSGAGGPLNVIFNADANGAGAAVGGGQVSFSGSIYTNGGNVAMSGAWANASNQMCSVCLTGATIDTRTGNVFLGSGYSGGSNAGTGGSVTLTGVSTGASFGAETNGAVWMQDSSITTATGNVTLFGSHTAGSGVQIERTSPVGAIATTSGNILLTGIGSFTSNSTEFPGHGVVINGAAITSESGDIAVHGRRLAGATAGSGVQLGNGALLQTTTTGDIEVTGQSDGNGAGVNLLPSQLPGSIDGHHDVVIRAVNDGSTDALAIGGPVSAGNVLNLRPGGLDLAGNAQDRPAVPVLIGGGANSGFAISGAELALINTPTLVVGSNAHAADITVTGALALGSELTLQNGAGGNINLGSPVSAPTLGLESAGDITQAAGAPITAGTLLARSTGGNVDLRNTLNNVSANTLGGGAAGSFAYVDSDAIRIGPVSVIGFDAAGNQPQVLSATSMAADTVFVRTLTGDLTLAGPVSSANGTDLVAAGRFQNPGGGAITGAPWRIWANTWVGETRGGLVGSGPLPNLFNCAFLGLCTVAVPPGTNHFIYAQQPTATVLINNASRPGGVPNPIFTYSITGLLLGDTASGFFGFVGSPATPTSPPGLYAIDGSFSSPAGYAVNVVPGLLTVGDFVQLPKPDVLRDMPTSWLYDRNIGQAPICFATGPLDGDRAAQGGDVLAREWSRVRSRPNLTSCVDTERRNGCGDF